MHPVNMLQAKSSLSRLVEAIELGHEKEIIIARNGRPVARLVPIGGALAGQRIGVAKGAFDVPDDIDAHNEEVARLFLGEGKALGEENTPGEPEA
jgi:antitoxin (DNA-binding transcriptional repressor) of toxin-antitoxin stability system